MLADTPEKIQFFRLCVLRGALRLEAAGMKKRGPSALSIAKGMGFKAKTAKEMLALIQAEIDKAKGG
jgi:hypothetical protein